MFAGAILVEHTQHYALIIATCAVLGQAVGTAVALGVKNNLNPRGFYKNKIMDL